MASAKDIMKLVVEADVGQAIREIEKVGKTSKREMDKAQNATDKWGSRLMFGGAAAVGFAAVAGRALFSFAKASEESALAQAKLDNVLATVPALAGANRQAFTDLASAIQRKTAADDDAVISAEAMLGQFGLTQTQILGLTPLVVDLSRKMGIDLDTAAKTVGKAMDGNAGALGRVGIQVDKNAFETNRYTAVQQGLAQAVGGFAEREGKTFSGQLAILKNQLGEVAEGLGGGVVGALRAVLGPITTVAQKFGELDQGTQHTIGGIAAIGTMAVGAAGSISFLAGSVMKMRERFLAVPADGLAGGLNVFGKAAGIAGIAAVGLGAAYMILNKNTKDVEKKVTDLTEAVKRNGTTLGQESATRVADYLSKHQDVATILTKAGISTREYTLAVQKGGEALDLVRRKLKEWRETANADTSSQAEWAQSFDVENELNANAKAFETSRKEIEANNKATKELADSQLDATGSSTALTNQQDKAAQTAKELADAEKAANDELQKQVDLVTGAPAAQRNYEQAQRDATQAAQDLAEKSALVNRTVGPEHDKAVIQQIEADKRAKDLIDDVATSAAIAAQKQAELNGGHLDAAGGAAAQRAALEKLRDQIGEPALKQYIDTLIQGLDNVARNRSGYLRYDMTITANGTFASPETANEFARRMAQGGFHLAKGGPVKANSPYIVGEVGPELFVPKQDGTIVPNNVLRSSRAVTGVPGMMADTSGQVPQVTINQTVNAIDAYSAAREASREVAWALRTARY